MKKIITFLLSALMALSLTACGGSDSSAETESTPASAGTTTETTGSETTGTPTEAELEEIVIYDNNDYTFSVTGIEENGFWGYSFTVYLENKTDEEVIFSLEDVAVNGYMCDPYWAISLPAGMKSNEEISFFQEDFNLNGITEVTDITFTLNFLNAETWDVLDSTTGAIYPLGEDAVTEQVRDAKEGDIVLFDDENCTMIVTGFDPDGFYGYTVNVYLENKTDATLMFSADGVGVNGYLCDPYWAVTVTAGKKCNTTISWFSEDFETNGITEVEEITLPITVYDYNNWDAKALIDDTYTVTP